MKFNKKIYIKTSMALKTKNTKEGLHIINNGKKPGLLLFLKPVISKNKKMAIKNKINIINGKFPIIRMIKGNKKFSKEIIVNSEQYYENAAKYFFVAIKVPVNSEFIIEEFDISFIENRNKIISENFKNNILVLAPLYPNVDDKYRCAFIHTRVKAYLESGFKIDLAVVNTNEECNYTYNYEGIEVNNLSYNDLRVLLQKKKYKKIIIHFFISEFAQILDASDITDTQIFINSHGADTLYWDRPKFVCKYFEQEYKMSIEEIDKCKEQDEIIKRYNNMSNVKFFFVSSFAQKRGEELLNIKYNNYDIIPCVIDDKIFKYIKKDKEQRKKICMIRPFKNYNSYSIDVNVKTILELSKRDFFKDLEFSIYGEGELHDLLLKPLEKFDNVKIYPFFLSSEEMAEVLKKHGISLFATRYDTQAVASLESAISGTIPITSYKTGVSCFLDEKNNNFAEPGDYKKMADIIEKLYYDENAFLDMSQAVHESVLKTAPKSKTIDKEVKIIKEFDTKLTLLPQKKLNKNPLLSIVIPAYNCGVFLPNTINSLINHKYNEKVEIIIVNDGSKDNTLEVTNKLAKLSPSIKVIDKKNGGHGSTINEGLKAATGKYFRLLDGDDYFITSNFVKYLELLEREESDIVLTNYIEDFAIDAFKNPKHIYDNLEPYKIYDLSLLNYPGYGFKGFGPLLSTATYKTKNLKDLNFKIDEHCFYVDMEYNFMGYVTSKTLTYYPLDIYCYYLGRSGQSMSPESLKRNSPHHEKVTIRLIKEYTKMKDSLKDSQKEYITNRLIVPLASMQYELAFNHFNNKKAFVSYDNKLKDYPEFYNDKRIVFRSVKLHRIFKGNLIRLHKLVLKLKSKIKK